MLLGPAESPPGHQGHQEVQSSCSLEGNETQVIAVVCCQIDPQSFLGATGETPQIQSTGQQTVCQVVVDALLQVSEPVREDMVLPGSTCSQLLEQNLCLQRVLKTWRGIVVPLDGELPLEKEMLSRSVRGGRETLTENIQAEDADQKGQLT